MKNVKVTVKRTEKDVVYKVPFTPKMRVLDALFHIQEKEQPDLAFRWNCGEGVCGSCAAEVNGRPVLMCKKEIEPTMAVIHVKPLQVFPVVKDLVTDPTEIYDKLAQLKPYFSAGQKQKEFYNIQEAEVKETQEMRKCIECYICYDSCHVIRNHPDLPFTGPMNIVKAVALDKHPREKIERSGLLRKEGLWNCNVTRCCTQSCPQNIKITENAIIWAKERSLNLRKKQKS